MSVKEIVIIGLVLAGGYWLGKMGALSRLTG